MKLLIGAAASRVYYGEHATPEYKKLIENFRVHAKPETITKARFIDDNNPGIREKRIPILALYIKGKPGSEPAKFITTDEKDISDLLSQYHIKPATGVQVIEELKGRKIDVYTYYHQIVAVSPVVD